MFSDVLDVHHGNAAEPGLLGAGADPQHVAHVCRAGARVRGVHPATTQVLPRPQSARTEADLCFWGVQTSQKLKIKGDYSVLFCV